MSDELFFENSKYISAADAATSFALHRDYVARLARTGKIKAKRVGKNWYVSEKSMQSFVINQEFTNAKRKRDLGFERRRAYVAAATKSGLPKGVAYKSQQPRVKFDARLALAAAVAKKKVSAQSLHATPLYAMHPALDFLHRAAALVTALALVFGSYAFADPETAKAVFAAMRTDAERMIASAVGLKEVQPAEYRAKTEAHLTASTFVAPATAYDLLAAAALSDVSPRSLAKGFNAAIDNFIFNTMFERAFAVFRMEGGRGTVFVTVAPSVRASNAAPLAQAARAQSTQATVINNPVIERTLHTERVISVSGISSAYLEQRLAVMNADFIGRITTMENANSTSLVSLSRSSGSSVDLSNIAITGGTITGATISGGSVTATAFSGVLPIANGGTG
ncbi:MAG: helix-turn-helix domain-containing protein, partial [Patescibacteria group bacterium]